MGGDPFGSKYCASAAALWAARAEQSSGGELLGRNWATQRAGLNDMEALRAQ